MTDLPVRIMAFVGVTVAGAFLLGWGVQLLARLAFNQQLPRWPLWGVRGLGAVLFGMLAWAWLFGTGGGWGAGGDGFALFGGRGKGPDKEGRKKEDDRKEKDRDRDKGKDRSKATDRDDVPVPSDTLRVEVLGDDALRKIAGNKGFDAAQRYRVSGEGGLHTLDETRKAVLRRRARTPPLRRLEIVVYTDSPSREGAQVTDLESWARDLAAGGEQLVVDVALRGRPAPVE
jgi:hypothetical protein